MEKYEEVHLAYFMDNEGLWGDQTDDQFIEELIKMGLNGVSKLQNENKKINFRAKLIPGFRYEKSLLKKIEEINPSILVGYHWDALAMISKSDYSLTKIGFVGDPLDGPFSLRSKFNKRFHVKNSFLSNLKSLFIIYFLRRYMRSILNSMDLSFAFAAHHAEELSVLSKKKCRYIQTPMPLEKSSKTKSIKNTKTFSILLLGHMFGIATRLGMEYFIHDIYPELKRLFSSEENFSINIVGDGKDSLPRELISEFDKKEIKFLGPIEDLDSIIDESHILLVPIPVDLGIRVRILTSFSKKLPVVCHYSNSKGIPELKDGLNCLMSNDAKNLAEKCYFAFKNPEYMQEIEKNAFDLVKNKFSINFFSNTFQSLIGEKNAS